MTVHPRNPYDAKIIEKMERCDSDTPLPIIFGSQHMSVHSIREDGTLIKHETVYIWPNTKKVVICPPKDVEVEVREVKE